MYVAWTLATLAVAGYGVARSAWQLTAACLAFNALETAGTIVWATLEQRHVPRHLLGRVSSLDWLISIGLLPVSFGLTGPASALLGVRTTLVASGIVGAAATLAPLFLPSVRVVDDEPQPARAASVHPPAGTLEETGPASGPAAAAAHRAHVEERRAAARAGAEGERHDRRVRLAGRVDAQAGRGGLAADGGRVVAHGGDA